MISGNLFQRVAQQLIWHVINPTSLDFLTPHDQFYPYIMPAKRVPLLPCMWPCDDPKHSNFVPIDLHPFTVPGCRHETHSAHPFELPILHQIWIFGCTQPAVPKCFWPFCYIYAILWCRRCDRYPLSGTRDKIIT